MNRTATIIMTLVLVVGSFAVGPAAATQPSTDVRASTNDAAATAQTNNTSNASISPGARLSGVIGVQETEIDGEVESRAFGLKVAKANTDEAKAEVVAEQLNESQERVEELEGRLEELEQARENGSISEGQYAAQAAKAQAELNNVKRMSNETANASEKLPRDVLEANGVNVTAIETLRQRASNMSGPEVAAIAQTIAGPSADQRPAEADNRTRGPGAGNQTAPGDRADGNQTAEGTAIPDDSTPNNGTLTEAPSDGAGSGDGGASDGGY